MSRYFFHLRDGTDILLDPEGVEIAGMQAVHASALAAARSILSADVLEGRLSLNLRIDVEDVQGAVVHRLRFADAVEIVPPEV